MLNSELNALALMRFGFGRGGGFFELLILVVAVGTVAWALTRPSGSDSAKRANAQATQPRPESDAAKS
jgi:hypothetical protein